MKVVFVLGEIVDFVVMIDDLFGDVCFEIIVVWLVELDGVDDFIGGFGV